LTITGRVEIPSYVVLSLIIGGLLLCVAWAYFLFQAIHSEKYYRVKAEEVEELTAGREVAYRGGYGLFKAFTLLSIFVFIGIYITILAFVVN
jgi:hypothetical protein|tara:strand:- start:343 stop:618 length:276 start_codon:yes stop_codon:yes gene_type:complete